MKVLLTLVLVTTGLTLSSCTSDGRCIFAGKKKADCCSTGAAACCTKKADDCKTCKP